MTLLRFNHRYVDDHNRQSVDVIPAGFTRESKNQTIYNTIFTTFFRHFFYKKSFGDMTLVPSVYSLIHVLIIHITINFTS